MLEWKSHSITSNRFITLVHRLYFVHTYVYISLRNLYLNPIPINPLTSDLNNAIRILIER